MRETILALLALSIATTMSLNVLSSSIQNQMLHIDREYEVYASNIATQVLDHITSRAFDERTTPDNLVNMGTGPDSTEFTLSSGFGSVTHCNLYQPYLDTIICDDIDDLHLPDSVWQSVDYMADTLSFPFEVNAQVQYVLSADPDSVVSAGMRTYGKQVTVTVRSVMHNQDNRQGGYAQLNRVVIYNDDDAAAQRDASQPMCDSGSTIYVNAIQVPIYINGGATLGACSP